MLALLSAILMCVSIEASAQGKKVTLRCNNVSLVQALYNVEKQSEYYKVNYNHDDLKSIHVTADINEKLAPEAVCILIKGKNLESSVDGRIILIAKSKSQSGQGGKHKAKGVLLDSDGSPLIGATIKVAGSNNGTITDAEGRYELDGVKEDDILEYSYLGMKSLKRKASAQQITVIMEEEDNTLDDVFITGYQNLKRENATGAFQQISSKEMDNRYTGDITSNLEGKIAGLVKYDNGVTNQLSIRGTSSLSANTNPLVVVNGLPITGNIESLNPYDIESITILKDAAAAAIYGARASNGVIVVATKKANREKLEIDFNADLNIYSRQNYDNFGYATAAEEMEIIEKNFNYYKDHNEWGFNSFISSYDLYNGCHNSPFMKLLIENYKGNLSDVQLNETKNMWGKNSYRNEWQDLMTRNKITQQYNLSLRTKGKYLNSSISVNYKNDNMGQNSLFDRTLMGNYDGHLDVAKWMDMSFGIFVESNSVKSRLDFFGLKGMNSYYNYETMWNADGTPKAIKGKVDLNESTLQDKSLGFKSEEFIIQNEVNKNFRNTRTTLLRPYIHLNVMPIEEIKLSAQFQYEDSYGKSEGLYEANSYDMRHLYNLYTYKGNHNLPDGGMLDVRTENGSHYTFRTQGTFNKIFAEKHAVEALAGFEYRETRLRTTGNLLLGYDDLTQTNTTYMTNFYDLYKQKYSDLGSSYSPTGYPITDFSSSDILHRFYSYYFTANYTYDHRYSLSASYRTDKTDLFGSDPKFRGRPLWSLGLSWNIHNEKFLSDIDWVNMLKLRTSYGLTGNINSNVSSYLTALIKSETIYGGKRAVLQTPPNDQLRWEKTASWNMGIDFSLFNNRVRGSLDYYLRNSSDVLSVTDVDPSQGWSSLTINNAKIKNQGVELQVTGDILRPATQKGLGIFATLGIAYNKNEVTEINHEITSGYEAIQSTTFHKGMPVHSLYSVQFGGFGLDDYGYQQAYIKKADGSLIAASTYDSSFKPEDAIFTGGTDPKLSGSFTPEITWNGFSLSAMFVFYTGHYMRVNGNDWYVTRGVEYDQPIYSSMANFWRADTQTEYLANGEAAYNMMMYTNEPAFFDFNTVHADYMKLRNLVLGYSFPSNLCQKIGVGGIRLRAQMNNVFKWVRNSQGIDPEANNPYTGMAMLSTPKSYTMSLSVNF